MTDEEKYTLQVEPPAPQNPYDEDVYSGTPEPETSPYAVGEHFTGRIYALVGAVGVVGLVVLGSAATWFDRPAEPSVAAGLVAVEPTEPEPLIPPHANPFETVEIVGKAAIVYDLSSDAELFRINSTEPMPLASLTKLMTGLVASEALDEADSIAITEDAIETEGDSGLFASETWNWRDLLSFTMMTSSNDGADALAAAAGARIASTLTTTDPEYRKVDAFVSHMNTRAQELELTDTFFRNPTGLDEGYTRGGADGSARDVARLVGYIWEHAPHVLDYTTVQTAQFASADGFTHRATNTNEYVYDIPGLLGSKTGYTDLAGGNLAIVFDAGLNHPIAVVVLGSTTEGRFSDVQELVDATYQYMESGWYDYEVAGTTPRS